MGARRITAASAPDESDSPEPAEEPSFADSYPSWNDEPPSGFDDPAEFSEPGFDDVPAFVDPAFRGSPTLRDAAAIAGPTRERTFPGGRVRLPRLDSMPVEPEMQFVGTAFIRSPNEDPAVDKAVGFDEYFTFESLFDEVEGDDEDANALAAFDVLGVTPETPWKQIVAAHRTLVKEHHPDHLSDADDDTRLAAEERLREINQAYSELNRRRAVS